MTEPAVLHAVLALSSVHKRESLNGSSQGSSDGAPDEQERFMLQHYIKATSHLQHHFSIKDGRSLRVSLITCVVFICLELLRGRFKTAQTHLQNGIKVLREMHNPSNVNENRYLSLNPSHEAADDWIVEVFSRLNIQVMLFNQSSRNPCLFLQDFGLELPISTPYSLNTAWQRLERFLSKVIYLSKQVKRQRASEHLPLEHPFTLLEHQQQVQAGLAQWLDMYKDSTKFMQSEEREGFVWHVLWAWQTMASIMAATCLRPDDEAVYDSYTEDFVSLVKHSAMNWKIRSSDEQNLALAGPGTNMSRTVVDIGWIPPLYYAALKCRVHRVRLQAIRLLECSPHREGIWDAEIATRVARKVMEIEERDFFRNVDTADDFSLSSIPELRDLALPVLPHSNRIHDVQVILPDGPMDSVFLSYKQQESNGDWKRSMKEYHIPSRCGMKGLEELG